MRERIYIRSPEAELKRLLLRLSGDDIRLWLCTLISALTAALLAYHYLIIFGGGNPDALGEGLLVYTGYDWALACGRWATRYMARLLSGNMVIPGLWVPLYALCCGISSLLICRLWRIEHLPSVCLVTVLLTVNPTVIEQSLLQYMFMAWGISNLLCVIVVFLCFEDEQGLRGLILCPFFIAVALGLYQACLGMLCLMLCMTLIISLARGAALGELLRPLLRFVLSMLIGLALYFVILRFELHRWGETESGRLTAFSLREIFTSLKTTLPGAYRTFFAYFFDRVFHRSLLYKLIFAIGTVCLLCSMAEAAGRRSRAGVLLMPLLTLAIPLCANVSDIVFPYNKPVLIMQYQSMLVIPFVLALISARREERRGWLLCRSLACLLALALAWGYTVSANTTYKVYERAYEYTYAAVASAMDRVYMLPDYQKGEPVAFAGFPDDSHIRDSRAYSLAYGKYDNLVFWEGFPGLQGGRTNYLSHFFGVDGGELPYDKFLAVLETEEFAEMELFPMDKSVRRIDGLIVVKFEEEFPLYG